MGIEVISGFPCLKMLFFHFRKIGTIRRTLSVSVFMMNIRYFFAILLLLVFTVGLTPPRSCAAELSAVQKEALLDKAEAALIWFYTLGDEVAMNRTPSEKYREHISPMELIQSAALLHSFGESEQTALAEKLLLILPYYRLTPDEMFEIHDILGETELRELAEIETPDLAKISVEAQRFRRDMLNNVEKIVLYQEPTTALELMKAVDVLSGVGRAVFVRHYLRRLLAGTPVLTPEESAKIVETIGTQKLMQIAIHPEFVPLGKEAVAKIIDSAKEHWQDEERIAEALREFVEESGGRSQEAGGKEPATVSPQTLPALKILWKGDQLSVQQVFEKLATIEDEAEADQLVAVLLSLRRDMKEALAAALGASNGRLRYHAARGLAASVTPQETFLLYQFVFNSDVPEEERAAVKNILQQRRISLPSQEQAAAILFERGTDYFEKRRPLRIDGEGNVPFWRWEFSTRLYGTDAEGIGYRSFENIEDAYLHFAVEYYIQSDMVIPKTSANRKEYALTLQMVLLEYSIYRFSPGTPLLTVIDHIENTTAIQIDTISDWEQLLKKSLENNRFVAATFAIRRLAEQGNTDLLQTNSFQSTNGKPRLMVQAVIAPNRNVRFAALEAIMKLTGTPATQSPALEPYAGSSLVADTLVWFSQSDGESVLLSGHPQMATAVQTANLFLGLAPENNKYKTDVATTCRDLFRLAAASPDVEMIVVDARTPQPPVGEFVQRMRQDARTAEIPIAILSNDARDHNPNVNTFQRNTMTEFDRRNPDSPFRTSLSLTYPLLANEESARWVHDDLIQKTADGRRQTAAEERLEMAKQALRWLRDIKLAELSTGTKIYHFEDFDAVVWNALHSERRVLEGLQLASVVKSSALQAAIYEMAANVVYPIWLREQAAEAFEESIERFGILLRGQQIQRLYDRYNASEFEPIESQKLLSRLIDVVEDKVGK